MNRPFIFGLKTSIEDSPFLTTDENCALVGQNTGNLVYQYAIDRMLGGNMAVLPWHSSPADIDAMQGVAVMPLANQLGRHCDMGDVAHRMRQLQSPFIGIGLGAQADIGQSEVTLPQGTQEWLRALQDHAPASGPNISLRGEFTRQVLERYALAEKTVVLGCPSLFISPERQLGHLIAQRYAEGIERIGVAAGLRQLPHLQRIEASLAYMARMTGGRYFCQHDIDMVRLGRAEAHLLDPAVRDACRNYIAPDMSDAEFIRWCNRQAVSYFSVAAWMEDLKKHDFVIGPRIHGVMLALQAGVPALCIAHDSRTIELCEIMRVPYVLATEVTGGVKRDDINHLFNFDPDGFDRNRRQLARLYVTFLEQNGLSPAKYLADLAATCSDESGQTT